jgi:integrase
MPKVTLDHNFALTATCEPGKRKIDFWHNGHPAGLVLEVRASGGRTWYLRYQDCAGRQRQFKIGGFGDITFAQAKKRAQELRSEVVLGGDPLARKEEKKAVPLYSSLAEQHLAHARGYQKSFSSTEINMRRHILPRWAKVRLDEIKPQVISQWLADKAAEGLKPATVEKIRVVLSRSFELGRLWHVPGCSTNPVKSVPRQRFNNARERYLTAEEAARLRSAVEESSNPQLKHIVGLLLLTGARVSELLRAEWRHVDLERRSWLIPTSKNGRPRHVPLSQDALAIIGELPRFGGCPYLVPNPETRLPYVSIKRAWQTARERAGLPDLRVHDLRHACASNLVAAGVDLYAVGKILGHTSVASSQRYAHLSDGPLRAAVEAGAATLQGTWSSKAAA